VLFEGSERAVGAQLESARKLVGGSESGPEVWEESRTRQAAARGRLRFGPGDLSRFLADVPEAVVRPASGVAYTRDPMPDDSLSQGDSTDALRSLLDRIQRELDPHGVLAA
jgi:hypothetical protein